MNEKRERLYRIDDSDPQCRHLELATHHSFTTPNGSYRNVVCNDCGCEFHAVTPATDELQYRIQEDA